MYGYFFTSHFSHLNFFVFEAFLPYTLTKSAILFNGLNKNGELFVSSLNSPYLCSVNSAISLFKSKLKTTEYGQAGIETNPS